MIPMRELVSHSIGGGWGEKLRADGTEQVAIIRGADFPGVAVGDTSGVPHRWESVRKLPQRTLQPGDIVLEGSGGTSDRPTGRTVFISQQLLDRFDVPVIPASFCRLVRIDPALADPHYVYWWLQGMYADGRTWGYQNRSTGIANFQFQHFLDTETVRLPSLDEQRAIASTLGALDDKIESNRRIIGLIPRLVRAHVNSAISHSSTFISVSDLATFVNGGAYTKGATGTGRMVIRIAELNSGPGSSTVYNDIKVPDEKIARAGDILMSWSGSLGVYRWYRDEAIINQHIFKVSPTGYPAWLVFDRLDEVMSVFRGVAADKATTMGHIQRGHLISTNVEIPTQGALEELETKISPLWDRLLLAERENLDLERLRDALLPELLSGRIHVTAEGAEA